MTRAGIRREPEAESSIAAADDRGHRPRWFRLVWFLGRPPPLTRRQWRVLGLVSLASLFDQYDLYLFSLNLKHIQVDLGIADAHLGWLGSTVNLGALGALFVTLTADRLGRRRVLLFTVIAYTVLTGATALAPNAASFVALQFLARTFAVAETLLAIVVITEEFDPESRGWGVGALGAIQACGAGLAAVAFGFVDVLPFGWRSLYLVGLFPLALLSWWRRTLPETGRFSRIASGRRERVQPSAQMLALFKTQPKRFAATASVAFLLALAASPATFFAPTYLQDAHGFTPASVASLNFFGGALAILANPFAGRLSDRRGRRPVIAAFSMGLVLSAIAFYNAPPLLAMPLWIAMIFTSMGSAITFAALGSEVFPTSQRSTAAGARSVAATFGGITGLALVSALYPWLGSNWTAISLIVAGGVSIPLIVMLSFPETAGRTLEELAPESV